MSPLNVKKIFKGFLLIEMLSVTRERAERGMIFSVISFMIFMDQLLYLYSCTKGSLSF